MRKKFKTLAYLPAIALFGIGIIRCVGGGASAGNCVVDDAISAAESQITIIESPVFGKLPSLFEQKLKAGTILSKQFGKIKTESMDEATRNQQHREDAEQTLDDYYQKKIEEAIEGLDGKISRWNLMGSRWLQPSVRSSLPIQSEPISIWSLM